MNVETMIFAYLAICVSMILFNIACIFVFESKEKKLDRTSWHFEEKIKEQFAIVTEDGQVSEEHVKYLSKKLEKVANLMAFDETMERLQKADPDSAAEYLNEIYPVFVSLAMNYRIKSELKLAYFPYILQKYEILKKKSSDSINAMLLKMVENPSLYCREIALKALSTTGKTEYIMRALKILDRGRFYHSPKLLTDGLLSFEGDCEELTARIWESYGEFSVSMKVTLLNYMRFRSGGYEERMLALLNNEQENEEVHYACIRYLGKYPLEEAYPVLLDLVKKERERTWQYAAIAASALASYPGDETVDALKEKLSSQNWYVRLNASKSLEILGLGYSDLIDILDGSDRYAREILLYRFDKRKANEKEAVEA